MTQQQLDKLSRESYLKYSLNDICTQETIDARKILCTARFDFYGILVYIDQKVNGVKNLTFAKNIYRERTFAMTGNKMSENGSDEKNSFEDFIKILDSLIDDFQNDRFDKERTLIPVDKDYVPMDGAHRVACAAYFDKQINILRFPEREYQFKGFQYLKDELLPDSIADVMALESVKWHDDLFVFFLWPQAHLYPEKLKLAQDIIYDNTDVMYDIEYRFSHSAIKNLMIQIYGHMDWLGNIDNEFANVLTKVDEVWANNGRIQLVITKGKSCEYITKLKAQIREMFGIGLSSCHSTDNIHDTRLALNILLNPNSRHFLERAKPTTFKRSFKLIDRFKKIVKDNDLCLNNFIIDSSMVLAIYGAREARDLDFYCLQNTNVNPFRSELDIEEHDNSQKQYHEYPFKDYIINPDHYFVFNEIKFMSLTNLLKFKQTRYLNTKEPKDASDIALIKEYCSHLTGFRQWIIKHRYNYLRKQRVCYNYVYALIFWRRREILEKVGLYKPLKAIKTLLVK